MLSLDCDEALFDMIKSHIIAEDVNIYNAN